MTVKAVQKSIALEKKLQAMYPKLNVAVYVSDYSIVLHADSAAGSFNEYVGDKIPNAQIIAENRAMFDELSHNTDSVERDVDTLKAHMETLDLDDLLYALQSRAIHSDRANMGSARYHDEQRAIAVIRAEITKRVNS